MGKRDPDTCFIACCSPWDISSKLDWKLDSQDLNCQIEDSVSSHIDHCSTKLDPNIRSYMSGLFSSCGYSTFGSSLLGWWTLVIGPFLLSVVDKAAVHMPRTAGAGPYDVPVVSLWGRQQVLVRGVVLEHHCILPTALQVQIATHPHQHLLFSIIIEIIMIITTWICK